MQMEVLIDGKWQPQVWYGPTARSLGEGKLVVEPFQTELSPEGPTALRTRILYRRGNQKAPAVGILEVLVPEAQQGAEHPRGTPSPNTWRARGAPTRPGRTRASHDEPGWLSRVASSSR
jgi:hypothetical protein